MSGHELPAPAASVESASSEDVDEGWGREAATRSSSAGAASIERELEAAAEAACDDRLYWCLPLW